MSDEKPGVLGISGALNIDERLVYLVRRKADGFLYKVFQDERPDERIEEPAAKEK